MSASLSYSQSFPEEAWGATFHQIACISDTGNIFICHASISDLEKIAGELSARVMDQSWIFDLDTRAQRAYKNTASKTAKSLVKVFETATSDDDEITSAFGELLVSMGSSKTLEVIFKHRCIPLAEIWKPKLLGNEGFDFHTVCLKNMINFGEAKFSSSSNPYGGVSGDKTGAGGQADGFILNEKHLMDNIHLGHLAGEEAAVNLDNDLFGIVLGFSINSKNPLQILKNAMDNCANYENLKRAKNIYIVGVSYEINTD
ncbi:hypothetical protein [Fluviicola sp.]|uniref:hypothetical protein n=1 Tax=Fluviicola sp. TaxID=1917219 RepID=UPI0031DD57FC